MHVRVVTKEGRATEESTFKLNYWTPRSINIYLRCFMLVLVCWFDAVLGGTLHIALASTSPTIAFTPSTAVHLDPKHYPKVPSLSSFYRYHPKPYLPEHGGSTCGAPRVAEDSDQVHPQGFNECGRLTPMVQRGMCPTSTLCVNL